MLKFTSTFPEAAKIILRVSTGVVFVYHGVLKLFAPFGGAGMAGFTRYLKNLQIPYPEISAYLAAGAEFFCGLALILGFLARWATIPLIATMAVAIVAVTGRNGFDIVNSGYEYNMILIAVLVSILLMGSGKFSLKD
ncbi:MAG: DoxX family protein [Nitrospinales bacterium]